MAGGMSRMASQSVFVRSRSMSLRVAFSRIHDDLAAGTTEQDLQAVEHIPTQDSLLAREVCLKLARILLTIQPDPDQEANRYRHAARDPLITPGTPRAGSRCSCWQSGQGRPRSLAILFQSISRILP